MVRDIVVRLVAGVANRGELHGGKVAATLPLAGLEDQERSDEIVEEARCMLVRYLELYLD